MPTSTYVAIDTKTVVGSSTSSVTFTNIPQGYTDLVIVVNGSNNTGDSEIAIRTGNGSVNTGSVYSTTFLFGNGSTPGSSRTSNRNWADAARTDTTRSTSIIHIMNYSNTTTNKTILGRGSNSTLAIATVSLVRDTVAINTVQLAAHYDATFNFTDGTTFTIYGIASADNFAKATGGIIREDANYWYHIFGANGTFTPKQALTCDFLVVAGGAGGGGSANAGGGGAGGLRSTVGATGGGGSLESAISVVSGTPYAITVGGGGAAGTGNYPSATKGTSGSNSVFSTITSIGGGGGGPNDDNGTDASGVTGGSGGGSASTGGTGGGTPGSGTTNQGYAGGFGYYDGGSARHAGGGGGAGGVGGGTTSSPTGNGGNGGAGVAISALATPTGTGVSNSYAGGGAGKGDTTNGIATAGGGAVATAGAANTGGGGGGGVGAAGGSGVVIVRYAK